MYISKMPAMRTQWSMGISTMDLHQPAVVHTGHVNDLRLEGRLNADSFAQDVGKATWEADTVEKPL